MAVGYFFDSYAIIELTNGNPRYARFSEETVILTMFNLVEIAYSALQKLGAEKAREAYHQLITSVHEIDEHTFFGALELKKKYKQRDLSYADCIGYAFAKQHALLFLTGDSKFEDLPNVEFVK
ncbi:PIN domain-containing protein [Candidatus Woesearchaeota archaeon]|nr:PIN domain-containing protein [Candidatus Woesearchaeota archaeon]